MTPSHIKALSRIIQCRDTALQITMQNSEPLPGIDTFMGIMFSEFANMYDAIEDQKHEISEKDKTIEELKKKLLEYEPENV